MINEKKITEAADLNADKYNPCRSSLDKEEACRASFKDGVEWFKQALWHERDEEPTEEGIIIKRLAKKGEIYLTFFKIQNINIVYLFDIIFILKYLFISNVW